MPANLVKSALLTSVSALAAVSGADANAAIPSSFRELEASNAIEMELDFAKVSEKYFEATGVTNSDSPLWVKFHEESGSLDISDISGDVIRVNIDEVRSAPPNVRGGS